MMTKLLILLYGEGKGKAIPVTGQDRPLGFQEIEAPTFLENGT